MNDTEHDSVRLSRSDLWQRQKDFYCREGVTAWQGKIPFYATSNAFIANAYAHVILAYMQDVLARSPALAGKPFRIVEVGAGPGIFAYHLVQRLTALLEMVNDPALDFLYVLTDVAERNLDFWCHHPAWEAAIASGRVDFAPLDLLGEAELTLEISGRRLSAAGDDDFVGAPMIAIANYVFDSIPNDLFRMADGELQEGQVPRSPVFESNFPANYAVTLEDINSPVRYQPITLPYYNEPARDALVQRYADELTDGHFCIPVAALDVIDRLTAIAGGEMLLLASDKAYSNHYPMYTVYEPELAFHNEAYSIMVNFHALGEYCRQRGGDCYHQRTQQGLATSAFLAGARFAELPRTRLAADTHLATFSPGDLFRLSTHLADAGASGALDALTAYLNAMQWDPELINQHQDVILDEIADADFSARKDLAEGVMRAAEHYYHVPDNVDTLSNLGVVLQELERYDDALQCYEASQRYGNDSDLLHYRLGLCQLGLGNCAEAVAMFEAALARNPDYVMAKGWLVQAREALADEASGECGSEAQP
jgi:tetratricopeptide (TPR) repeat protein